MAPQDEFNSFITKWGGRARLFQLLQEFETSPDANFGNELGELVGINPYAKEKIAEIIQVITKGALSMVCCRNRSKARLTPTVPRRRMTFLRQSLTNTFTGQK